MIEPSDYEQFWGALYHTTLQGKGTLKTTSIDPDQNDWLVEVVSYAGLEQFEVGGWLLTPKHEPVNAGFVVGHGYGGRAAPDEWLPRSDAAYLFPCARGFNLSARADLPETAAWHVLHGIRGRETYLHKYCVADLWAGATVLLQKYPQVEAQLFYLGGSFGGGLGAMMLAWDSRFQRGYLEVPSFGDHPSRLQAPCAGSGEAVRIYHKQHPEVLEVLQYYDAAVAARRISCPVFCACSERDPAVPPVGQFAVFENVGGPKKLFRLTAGHASYPEESVERAALCEQMIEWFNGEAVV